MASAPISLAEVPAIIDRLENSRFNYLDIQWGELRITLGGQPPSAQGVAPADPAVVRVAPAPATQPASVPPAATTVAASLPLAQVGSVAEGTPIRAPMVGRFYARPEPGAAPFVQVGDRVTADTTVGLIEVMKVFNAVTAGVAGEVLSLAVGEGEFVEFDQPLAYVRA